MSITFEVGTLLADTMRYCAFYFSSAFLWWGFFYTPSNRRRNK